jgi:hypothetical protein
VYKIAGILSISQSLLYISAVIALLLMPKNQLLGSMDQFAHSYNQNPYYFITMSLSFILLGLLGFIAVAPATAKILSVKHKGLATIGKYIALLCLSITTIYFTWLLTTTDKEVAMYLHGDEITKKVLSILHPHAPFNWIAWFTFGGMGVWVFIVGWLNYDNKTMPKGFAFACVAKVCGFWLILLGIVTQIWLLILIGAVIGGLIGGPLYHLILGYYLYSYKNDNEKTNLF